MPAAVRSAARSRIASSSTPSGRLPDAISSLIASKESTPVAATRARIASASPELTMPSSERILLSALSWSAVSIPAAFKTAAVAISGSVDL